MIGALLCCDVLVRYVMLCYVLCCVVVFGVRCVYLVCVVVLIMFVLWCFVVCWVVVSFRFFSVCFRFVSEFVFCCWFVLVWFGWVCLDLVRVGWFGFDLGCGA